MSALLPPYLRLIPGGSSLNIQRGPRKAPASADAPQAPAPKVLFPVVKKNLAAPLASAAEAQAALNKLLPSLNYVSPGDIHANLDYHNSLKLLL
jgi:hypothetical protein